MKKRVVQVVNSYIEHDGIHNIIRGIHEEVLRQDLDSQISAIETSGLQECTFHDPQLVNLNLWYSESFNRETIFIYHFGIHNKIIDHFFTTNRVKNCVFYYHNITPFHFFTGWDPNLELELKVTYKTLSKLLDSNPWVITGDSQFNIDELLMHKQLTKLPPILPTFFFENISLKTQFDLAEKNKFSLVKILFVGRFVPNKKHDYLLYLAKYLKDKGHDFELILVGKQTSIYLKYLKLLNKILKLNNSVQIIEEASDKELKDFYSHCHYFVVMSEHEGFCMPIIEANYFGCITLARPFGAISEIMNFSPGLNKNTSLMGFFKLIESIISMTHRNPEEFQRIYDLCNSSLKFNLKNYWLTSDFVHYLKTYSKGDNSLLNFNQLKKDTDISNINVKPSFFSQELNFIDSIKSNILIIKFTFIFSTLELIKNIFVTFISIKWIRKLLTFIFK